MSEDLWFLNMFGIDVHARPLAKEEARIRFMEHYAEDSKNRQRDWTGRTASGESLTSVSSMLARDLHSTYGPTVDTGSLMQNEAPTSIHILT